jgi:hypothetical protein
VTAKLYAEGGGAGQLYDSMFRQAWKAFFEAAGLHGRLPKVVRGGGRQQAFDMFKTAIASPRPGEVPMLLVDSEDAVGAGQTVWAHLRARDGWVKPSGVSEEHAFLMVQVMETWFLADRTLLRHYVGTTLREVHLKEWHVLEDVPKATVLESLEQATAGCTKRYAKGRVSFELLSKLNPDAVEASCPHAGRLLERLRSIG